MIKDDLKIIIWITFLVAFIVCQIRFRLYKQRQARERIQRNVTNLISSQARPLIIYHLPVSPIQESAPPSYEQAVRN